VILLYHTFDCLSRGFQHFFLEILLDGAWLVDYTTLIRGLTVFCLVLSPSPLDNYSIPQITENAKWQNAQKNAQQIQLFCAFCWGARAELES